MEGRDDFPTLILLHIFDRSYGYTLSVQPFLDDGAHGIFANRYPYRPNSLGLSIVRLLKRDGALLDIKPYIPGFDQHLDASPGRYQKQAQPWLL